MISYIPTEIIQFMQYFRLLYIVGFVNLIVLMGGEFIVLVFFFICDGNRILITAEMLPCLITSSFSVLKSLVLILKRAEICLLIRDLADMWPDTKIGSINKIVRENMISAKAYFKFYMYGTVNVAVVYNILPILRILYNLIMSQYFGHFDKWNNKISQPYAVWYPYDYGVSVWIFIPTYVSQFYAGKQI